MIILPLEVLFTKTVGMVVSDPDDAVPDNIVVEGVGTAVALVVGPGCVTGCVAGEDVSVHPANNPAVRMRTQPITVITYSGFMVFTF